MKRVALELDSLEGPDKEPNREFLVLQGVRFAFVFIRELLTLQNAYLAGLLSPQKSQYGLNHGYYGNSAYGLGMSYPGSPLGSSLLPNSALGSGSPGRHGERSLRFPSGIRNLVRDVQVSVLAEAVNFKRLLKPFQDAPKLLILSQRNLRLMHPYIADLPFAGNIALAVDLKIFTQGYE